MREPRLQNRNQARTAADYLIALEDKIQADDISLEEIQKIHHEMEDIVEELELFHQTCGLRLVVDNT